MKKRIGNTITTVLNSYAILFFSQNRVLGLLLLSASFINIDAGITGVLCVLFSVLVSNSLGYCRQSAQSGLYSFNILLLGIGFGTFFHFNSAFFLWLIAAGLLCIMLTIVLVDKLGKQGLPVLSLPFVLTFWLVLSASNGFIGMGLNQKNSALLNEMANPASQAIVGIINFFHCIKLPYYPDLFFRSLSAILFQNSVLTGIIIAIGILVHSRIALSLMICGFIAACVFNSLTGTFPEGISYYHLGGNLMMVSSAIGGFFLIPSFRSYLWAILGIIISILLINGLTRLLGIAGLPVFSMPFCIVTLLMLRFLMLRVSPGKLQLTPLQHYSPEVNLYQYLNGLDRLQDLRYLRLNLPFLGTWSVSQGYEGDITHKGEWSKAIDFVIVDEERRTFMEPASRPEHFYCFNKPVLACADGVVEEVVNHVEDNEIGEVNMVQNWGNSIVIKHATGLYSKVSHLRKNSAKVKSGDFVKQGDVIGLCGNSGRSPEPHLHFQLQTTAYVGSKTFEYPFGYFIEEANQNRQLKSFSVPMEGSLVSQVETSNQLKQAFTLLPGHSGIIQSAGRPDEQWEVFTDAMNQTYIYSAATDATAYFINNGTAFYFTAFYGDKNSLLHYFYLGAYKVFLIADPTINADDKYPLQSGAFITGLWLHDMLAPFYQYITRHYQSKCINHGTGFSIQSTERREMFGKQTKVMEASIQVSGNMITGFKVNFNGKTIQAKWLTDDIH